MSGFDPSDEPGQGFEAEMRQSLQRHAADAPRIDLTSATLRRARRIRLRRRIASGAAVLAVAAVGIPVGTALFDDARTSNVADPDRTIPTTDGTSETTGASTPLTDVMLKGLPSGPEPSVPYIFKAQFVQDGQSTDIPGLPATAYRPNPSSMLLDAATFPDGVAGFVLDTRTGTTTVATGLGSALPSSPRTSQPAIDHNGAVAFAVSDAQTGSAAGGDAIVYAENLRGPSRYAYPDQLQVKQVMDVEQGVALFNATTSSGQQVVGRADFNQGSPAPVEQPWPTVVSVSAADQADGLMAGRTTDMRKGERACSAMLSTSDASELWRSCTWRPTEFSPDGSRVFAISSDTEGFGPRAAAILDSRTGAIIREFTTPGTFGRATFEADNALVIVTVDRGNSAIVRCTESGRCELATSPQPALTDSLVSPYQLTANP
ncbi:MAG: hypothetical protein WBV37_12845 [Nocardioidaceae bacterium]